MISSSQSPLPVLPVVRAASKGARLILGTKLPTTSVVMGNRSFLRTMVARRVRASLTLTPVLRAR
jgi:hypothetical protein